MAAYCQVYGVIHITSPAGWLPVHRDQLRAQRSVTSMGKLYLFMWKNIREIYSFFHCCCQGWLTHISRINLLKHFHDMCKLQNNCSRLPRKQDPSSDHTGKDWSEEQNGNCRWTGGIPTRQGDEIKSRISEYWRTIRAREHQQPLYMCFVDFKKAFDSISHDKLWVTMMDMGYPLHLIDLLAKLYRKQLAKVKVVGTLSEWFLLRKGSDKVVSCLRTCSTS